jgi:LEA14-like dessication related protein
MARLKIVVTCGMKSSVGVLIVSCFGLIFLTSCQKPEGLKFTGFRNFEVMPLSLSSSKISCEVGVHNPNRFDISVKHLEANLALSGKSLGNYLLDSTVLLPAGGDFYLPILLEVKNASILTNGLSVLLGDSIPYTVVGKVRGGRKKIMTEMPFSYSGQLSSKDFHF